MRIGSVGNESQHPAFAQLKSKPRPNELTTGQLIWMQHMFALYETNMIQPAVNRTTGGLTDRVEKSRDFSRSSDQIPLNSFGCYDFISITCLAMMQRIEPVGNARATNDLV
jgi:hypothetical protein